MRLWIAAAIAPVRPDSAIQLGGGAGYAREEEGAAAGVDGAGCFDAGGGCVLGE